MDLIRKYFPGLSTNQLNDFERLYDLYHYWNQRINVISRKDIDSLYEKHVLHSLSIAKAITFIPETKIADIGTGGGFPGIPLAIFYKDVQFTLVDSIAKKIKVVNDIIRQLELKNCRALTCRAEELQEHFEFVVSRAVTSLPVFFKWVKPIAKYSLRNEMENGIIYLKGGEFNDELAPFKKKKVFDIHTYFEEAFFVTKKIVYLPFRQ
jgi:16S rRNA (guanine527-N7)-methyltransferase